MSLIGRHGEERDHVHAEQAARYPGVADDADQPAGSRTSPVLDLHRAA